MLLPLLLLPALPVDDARHLLGRTGFGPTAAEVEKALPLSREQAVDRILKDVRSTPTVAPPSFVHDPLPPRPTDDEEKIEMRDMTRSNAIELKSWWADEM